MNDLRDQALRRTRAETLAHELRTAIEAARDESAEDPFGNPILLVALSLTRRLDRGDIDEDDLAALVQHIGWEAVHDRAGRLRRYVGLDGDVPDALMTLAERIAGTADADAAGFERFRDEIERPRFAAVFTAHPTFGMSRGVAGTVAQMASRGVEAGDAHHAAIPSFRPDARISLQDEFEQARFAVLHARDAIDALNGAFFAVSRRLWRDRWTELAPRPVTLGSWVGCDTDGRTDIGWWDTLRYRLESKRGQFTRILAKLPEHPATAEPRGIVQAARAAVERQLSKAPPLASKPSLEALRDFALVIIQERETALPDASGLIAALDRALAETGEDDLRTALCLTKAGCVAHGVSIALPHFRLNASQLHNAMRRTIRVEGEPTEPARRRAFLAAVNGALDNVDAVAIDFGALAAERASATRMLMTIAQIIKHLDSSRPVRFLVAETETGYTLLSALWLARRLGVADRVEISPLFETEEGLEQGPRVIDEALRSLHWRNYLRRHGRFCIQFGYSDSGRYIGQIAATFWIERLRARIAQLLAHYDLTDVELVIFDTHGESFGRGAHPASLTDRLAYLAPPWSQHVFARAGIGVVRESSFQGSDGYLLFGSFSLAGATVSRIAESVFGQTEDGMVDPIYEEPDFATEFFGTVRQEMADLVDDPGYAALIGTFGPSLLDTTGSRPTARQIEGAAPARIRHPRELRAIPNNAILQQLGWLANSIHGLGHAASRAPDLFRHMRQRSGRFERAYRLAEHAMAMSDLDVIRAYVDTLDPGSWFDRARRTKREGRRDELLAVAEALERLDLAPALRRLFRRFATDSLKLKTVAGDVPPMSTRLASLHVLRLTVIHRIWLTATHIPDFRPQNGLSRELLLERILRLDIPASLALLSQIFPSAPDPTADLDFGEPPGPREGDTYEALHRDIFEPMRRSFDLVREISGAIQHEIGAFG